MFWANGAAGHFVFLTLAAGALSLACGSSEDAGTGKSTTDGGGGAGGTLTEFPGCTFQPDCAACKTCEESCHCATGKTDECTEICSQMGGGAGGAAGGSTGGSGGTLPTGGAAGVGAVAGTGNVGTGGGGGAPTTVFDCFEDIYGMGALAVPNYDQFMPVVGSHCSGTNHQDIQGVEKVVFLGDSITAMDYALFPPLTASPQLIWRLQATEMLKQKFPGVEIADCSKDGARNDDFLMGGNQIPNCFPGVEQKKTLILITMGGNDLRVMAEAKMSAMEYQPLVDTMVTQMRDAVTWLKDPKNFPNGSYVVFANVYEYTDTSADMSSCLAANLLGLTGEWLSGVAAIVQIAEQYMKIAVDTQSDMVFMLEHFCGHGYRRDDANLQCYRGPGAELYFDPTCIHPSDAGATVLARLFMDVVNE